jgi:hypothetical protein
MGAAAELCQLQQRGCTLAISNAEIHNLMAYLQTLR